MAETTWYAVLTTIDTKDYPAGSLVSMGTVIPEQAKLDADNLEAVDIGQYDEAGPDMTVKEFNTVTKTLVDRAPEPDPVGDLLAVTPWDSDDVEQALKFMLQRLYGK